MSKGKFETTRNFAIPFDIPNFWDRNPCSEASAPPTLPLAMPMPVVVVSHSLSFFNLHKGRRTRSTTQGLPRPSCSRKSRHRDGPNTNHLNYPYRCT